MGDGERVLGRMLAARWGRGLCEETCVNMCVYYLQVYPHLTPLTHLTPSLYLSPLTSISSGASDECLRRTYKDKSDLYAYVFVHFLQVPPSAELAYIMAELQKPRSK